MESFAFERCRGGRGPAYRRGGAGRALRLPRRGLRGGSPRPGAEPFLINTRVRHEKWDEGLVQRYEGDKMVILFDEVGYKTLSVELVKDRACSKL